MKDYSDVLKDAEDGKYIKEVPPAGMPVREISHSLKQISVARAKLAEQKEDAEKQTKSSNRIAVFSLAVSFVSAVAAVASAVIAYMALTPAG